MVEATLLAISLMWFPVALLLLGKGEAKGTGFATALVGIITVVSGILVTILYKNPWVGSLLIVYGFFYLTVAYSLIAGLQDTRSVGNVSLTVAIISIVYVILSLTGGPVLEGGKRLIERSDFLALACAGYTVLYIMVWLNSYGKMSAKPLAWGLIIWTILGLWIPGFWLLAAGKLPF